MRLHWLGALTLLATAPTGAHASLATSNLASLSDDELKSQFEAANHSRDQETMCTKAIAAADELSRRHPDMKGYEGASLTLQISCDFWHARWEAAKPLVARLNDLFGPAFGAQYEIFLAMNANDASEVLKWLRLAVETDGIQLMRPQQVFEAVRVLRASPKKTEFESFALEVSRQGNFARLQPGVQSTFAWDGLGAAMKTGDGAAIETLVPYLRSPYDIIHVLPLREYEAAWPALEAHAGDHLAKLSADYVDWSLAQLNQKPDDRDRLQGYAEALLFAGRFEDLVALTGKWLDTPEHKGKIEEGDAWAMDMQAGALDMLGRSAEADKLFDRLAALSADENAWVVNFTINRAGRLAGMGRWAEAVAASDLAKSEAAKYGTPYARVAVSSDRTCALFKLGRAQDSEQEIAYLRLHAKDAPGNAAAALMCAGHEDEAATMVAQFLNDDAVRPSLLRDLQSRRFSVFGERNSKLPDVHDLVFSRPELRQVALKYIRELPENLVPMASMRAAELERRTKPASQS